MSSRTGDNVTLAIVLSLLALALFDCMGLIIKYLSPRYHAAELSTYRNLVGLLPAALALWSSRAWQAGGRKLRIRQWPLGCLRGVFTTFAQFMFYFSLGKLAFATAATITYANALFMTALAVPMLGERVGPVRWAAVLVGFAGVLWIMKPGSDAFSLAALSALGAAFLYALAGVTARLMDAEVPSPLVNLYSSGTAMIGSVILVVSTNGFTGLLQTQDLLWIVGMGIFGGSAVLCLVIAYRMAEQSDLAPFSYFGIPMAFVFGWVFFDEAPWGDLFPGAILIVMGGLMVIWRERKLRRR